MLIGVLLSYNDKLTFVLTQGSEGDILYQNPEVIKFTLLIFLP